jgi:hypothetical protein
MLRRTIFAVVAVLLAGCASTKVTDETPLVPGVTKPKNVLVYDFIGDPNMIPPDSVAAAKVDRTDPPSPEDIQTANEYGAVIAKRLAEDIRAMGMPAMHATPGEQPAVGDGVIKGYIVSTESGKAGRRLLIGFGTGKSEMETVVEGYGMTPQGLRPLGSGTIGAASGKTPGLLVPAAVAAAGNPVGLVVMGSVKLYNEASGKSGLEGRANATADEIAAQLKIRFKERGWITEEG